jgi:predicted permease
MGSAYLPRLDGVGLSVPVLLFALGASLGSGVLFGLAPLLKLGRLQVLSALKEGGPRGISSRGKNRARNVLVVGQIALALILLAGSGLMIRSFQALHAVDPGFSDSQDIMTLRLNIPNTEVSDPMTVGQTFELIQEQLAEIPGVVSVGLGDKVPMEGENSFDPIFVEGKETAEGQLPPIRAFKFVEEGYLETLEIPLVAGRALNWSDARTLNSVVMVSENFAREFWDSPVDAIGKRLSAGLEEGCWREIVGVVGNVHEEGVTKEPPSVVYWPVMVDNLYRDPTGGHITVRRSMTFAIGSPRVGSGDLLQEIQQAVWGVNPNLSVGAAQTLQRIVGHSMARTSFNLMMLGIATAVALLLGIIGIYSVVAYAVSQRTREIGIRMALGADGEELTLMVLRHGFSMAAAGVPLGLAGALGSTRLLETLLFGVSPSDQ